MRYFKLENSNGKILDITTKQVFFHDISGIGFQEETDFRSVGNVWILNSKAYSQTPVSGSMCFTDLGNSSPYKLYTSFKDFITFAPLTLIYYPYGTSGLSYRKKVRVTKLEKSEINQLGVLDVSIDFTPYTPWYRVITAKNIDPSSIDNSTGWVWRDTSDSSSKSLIFRQNNSSGIVYPTLGSNQIPAKFRGETQSYVRITSPVSDECPTKLTIYGPAVNPVWSQYIDGNLIASGGFDNSRTVSIASNEQLIVDNTEGTYSMYVKSGANVRNVYSLRNFDLSCFFTLKPGTNTISATSTGGGALHMEVEGHIHYATV